MDAFLIGDAEEALREILGIVADHKRGRGLGIGARESGDDAHLSSSQSPVPQPQSRRHLLWRLATEVPGVYVPSLYAVPAGGGTARPVDARLPWPVVARTVSELRPEDHPRRMLVPMTG